MGLKEGRCGKSMRYRDGKGVYELSSIFGYDFGAENFARWFFSEESHEPVLGLHENGFPVVIERIVGGNVFNIPLLQLLFGESDPSDLGIGEDDIEHVVVVEGSLFDPGSMVGCELTL